MESVSCGFQKICDTAIFFDTVSKFGDNLARLRRRAQLSGRELAKALGVTAPVISKIETGRTGMPGGTMLMRIAKALNCTVDELLDGVDPDYDKLRRDLIRQAAEAGSPLPAERGTDVPASGTQIGRGLLERVSELEHDLASTRELATRLANLFEQSGVSTKSGSPAKPAAGHRRRDRKTG